MKFNSIFITLLLCFLMPFAFGQNYYADIQIYVENDGSTSILGNTDFPLFKNSTNVQSFTSKDANIWTLNISTTERFENFVFELNLPENANVNYIKTTPNFRIETENDRIKIIGIGEDKPFTLLVQYKIDHVNKLFSEKNILFGLIILFIISLLIVIFVGFRIVKKLKLNLRDEIEKLKKRASNVTKTTLHTNNKEQKKPEKVEKNDKNENLKIKEKEKNNIDLSLFSPRQQDIIKILEEKGKITQKELETIMKIPKSSISRNIQTLVIKGVIQKESVGLTNYISLK